MLCIKYFGGSDMIQRTRLIEDQVDIVGVVFRNNGVYSKGIVCGFCAGSNDRDDGCFVAHVSACGKYVDMPICEKCAEGCVKQLMTYHNDKLTKLEGLFLNIKPKQACGV